MWEEKLPHDGETLLSQPTHLIHHFLQTRPLKHSRQLPRYQQDPEDSVEMISVIQVESIDWLFTWSQNDRFPTVVFPFLFVLDADDDDDRRSSHQDNAWSNSNGMITNYKFVNYAKRVSVMGDWRDHSSHRGGWTPSILYQWIHARVIEHGPCAVIEHRQFAVLPNVHSQIRVLKRDIASSFPISSSLLIFRTENFECRYQLKMSPAWTDGESFVAIPPWYKTRIA